MRSLALQGLFAFLVFFSTHTSVADNTKTPIGNAKAQKASYQKPSIAHKLTRELADKATPLVFSAPPRETADVADEKYKPIAEYLSKVIGRKIVYKYPSTWGIYRTEMLSGKYDLIFDGPHFNSYRAQYLNHNILAKIPANHQFVVITKKGEKRFNHLKELAGRTFCTHAPPNLGTLTLLNEFDNPARQPVILSTNGWKKIYTGVISGQCVAGILPKLNLEKYDAKGTHTNIVFQAKVLPNQAFSAGPRISAQEQMKIAQALVAPEASGPTAKLRFTYKVGKRFAPARNKEFVGVSAFLKSEWGYF